MELREQTDLAAKVITSIPFDELKELDSPIVQEKKHRHKLMKHRIFILATDSLVAYLRHRAHPKFITEN